MILESADKMHQIAAEHVKLYDIDDELARNIKEQAKKGRFYYWFRGALDEETDQKLGHMQYTIDVRRICNKVFTKISW